MNNAVTPILPMTSTVAILATIIWTNVPEKALSCRPFCSLNLQIRADSEILGFVMGELHPSRFAEKLTNQLVFEDQNLIETILRQHGTGQTCGSFMCFGEYSARDPPPLIGSSRFPSATLAEPHTASWTVNPCPSSPQACSVIVQ